METGRDIFHIALGFLIGFLMMLGLISVFLFLGTQGECVVSLYKGLQGLKTFVTNL